MQVLTDAANTRNWLVASQGIRVAAYVHNSALTLSVRHDPFAGVDVGQALREATVAYGTCVPHLAELELFEELRAWDAASDEALVKFEQELG